MDMSKFTGDFGKKNSKDLPPFFKPADLPKNGKPLKVTFLTAPKESNAPYSDFQMDLRAGKKTFTLGLQQNSVLLGQLVQALGKNGNRWKGKTVEFYLAKGKYINIKV